MAGIYRPLELTREEIRLLELLPGPSVDAQEESPLRCNLLYRFLDEPGEYEGLSYVWGEPTLTEVVHVDGHEVRITKNLDIALRHLRLESEPRVLWVDALCINQEDVNERSHQVTLMKSIYQRCKQDVAWLGPTADDKSSRAAKVALGFDLMQKMGSKTVANLFSDAWDRDDEKDPERKKIKVLKEAQKNALHHAFNAPQLWERIWVVQELACSGEVMLVYGRRTLNWKFLADFLGDRPYADAFHAPFGHGHQGPILTSLFGRPQSIEQQRRIMRDVENGYSSTLLDVLARFRYASATDPRDAIYGLLGLVTEPHSIRVDYCKTKKQVFTDVAEWLINSRGDLDIIDQNPWQTDLPKQRPTWAPEFAHPNYLGRLQHLSSLLFAQRSIFAAGRASCAIPAVIDQGRFLRTTGCVLGRLGPIRQDDFTLPPDEYVKGRPWTSMYHAGGDWMRLYFGNSLFDDRDALYQGTQSRFTAFWRTLVMDCKAYPIERLSEENIEADEKIWSQFLLAEDEGKHTVGDEWRALYRKMVSGVMWFRNYDRWTFSVSDNGLFVMVRQGAEEGDLIVAVDGSKVPLLIREAEGEGDTKRYTFVNPVYVHGFMDGQAISMSEAGELKEQFFWLA